MPTVPTNVKHCACTMYNIEGIACPLPGLSLQQPIPQQLHRQNQNTNTNTMHAPCLATK